MVRIILTIITLMQLAACSSMYSKPAFTLDERREKCVHRLIDKQVDAMIAARICFKIVSGVYDRQ